MAADEGSASYQVPIDTPRQGYTERDCEKVWEGNVKVIKEVLEKTNINPEDITRHMNDSKRLYDKKDDDGNSSGTTVQCVKITKTNKDGKKEPVQYIKAVRGGAKPGEEPVSYYRIKDGTDVRDVLDQIQTNGKPDGTDGVDYNKVKGDELF